MVDYATVGVSLVGSAIVSLLAAEYRIRRERAVESSQELENWYQDVAALARQVQRKWESIFVETREAGEYPSWDELQSEMGLLADQLDRKASSAPDGVEYDVVDQIHTTASNCRRISDIRTHMNVEPEFREAGDDAVAAAETLERVANKETQDESLVSNWFPLA